MKYKKPQITSKKVKLNMFLSNRARDSFAFPLIGPVFAQSGGCNGTASCLVGGGGGGGACVCQGGGSGVTGCITSQCCFLKGTLVLMHDGSTKPIEEVTQGDEIISYDTNTNQQVTRNVDKLITHENEADGYLIINDKFKVTPNHITYVNKEWKEANTIKKGDSLTSPKGENIIVESVEHIEGILDYVFNLEVNGEEHNYFADGVLVHNKIIGGTQEGCFLKGTKVLLPNGSTIKIEKIKAGDIVAAYDINSNSIVEREVMNCTTQSHDGGYLIVNKVLKVTQNHIMYINDNWIEAEFLKVGDFLLDSKGKKIKVETIERSEEKLDCVYNFEVNGSEHNYFAEGILVHNVEKGGNGAGGSCGGCGGNGCDSGGVPGS